MTSGNQHPDAHLAIRPAYRSPATGTVTVSSPRLPWPKHKELLWRLYIDESQTLTQVMEYMAKQYQFVARCVLPIFIRFCETPTQAKIRDLAGWLSASSSINANFAFGAFGKTSGFPSPTLVAPASPPQISPRSKESSQEEQSFCPMG